MEQKEIDRVYTKYKRAINMSFIELLQWSKNPLSSKASLSRAPIQRNLGLLGKSKNNWNAYDVTKANRTISYLARAKGIEKEYRLSNRGDLRLTPNRISLRNWGFDVFKSGRLLKVKEF